MRSPTVTATRLAAFLRAFPWLSRYEWGSVTGIVVALLTLGRCRERLERDLWGSPLPDRGPSTWHFATVILLNKAGEELARVDKDETVCQTLERMGNRSSEVAFILERNDHTRYPPRVVLYKAPTGYSIPSWLEETIRREQAVLAEELESIEIDSLNSAR